MILISGIKNMKKRTYEECHKIIDGQLYKSCSCHEEHFPEEDSWFPCNEEYFYKNNKSPDELFPYCKKCEKQKSTEWRQKPENREKWLEINKVRNSNPNKKKQIKESMKKYREDGRQLKWQQNNPNKVKNYNTYREMNKNHKITKKEWKSCKEYFNNCCAYCGLPIEQHYITYRKVAKLGDFHKEHVNHEGANDLSNCVPSCKECNSEKHTYKLEEWYNHDNDKFNQKRLDKIHKWLDNDYKIFTE